MTMEGHSRSYAKPLKISDSRNQKMKKALKSAETPRFIKKKRESNDSRFLVRVFITDLQKDRRTYSFRAGFACDISEKRNLIGNRL